MNSQIAKNLQVVNSLGDGLRDAIDRHDHRAEAALRMQMDRFVLRWAAFTRVYYWKLVWMWMRNKG